MARAATSCRRRNPTREIPVVCAWCQKHLDGPKPIGKKKISHGICDACLEIQLAEIENAGAIPARKPHQDNPHCWWMREPHPPATRENPVATGSTSSMPPRPWGKVYKEVNKAIDQAFAKSTMDSAIKHLKGKAWRLFVKHVLPERVESAKRKGEKRKWQRKASTPSQLAQLKEKDWQRFTHERLRPAPEIEHPVDHLVELVVALEMAMDGTGPVPWPWAFKITLEAHQWTETVGRRYKTKTGAINGTMKKAHSLRHGTKTKRPNIPAAAMLEALATDGQLNRVDFEGGPIPKKDALPQFKKRVAPVMSQAAADERMIGVALFAMREDPRVKRLGEAFAKGIPAAYGGTRSWGTGTPSYKGRGFTFIDLRGYDKDKLFGRGTPHGSIGKLPDRIQFALVMKAPGGSYAWWFLGSQLEILHRALGVGDQFPTERKKKFGAKLENKAWNVIVRPDVFPVVIGFTNFAEAGRRYQQLDGEGEWIVYPFDAEKDVEVIWNGYTSKRPKPRAGEAHISVVRVTPQIIEPFYVVMKHKPGKKASKSGPADPGFIPGMPSGGTLYVSYPRPQPPAIWKTAFENLLQEKELRGMAPGRVARARKAILTQKRVDEITKASPKPAEGAMCPKWPETYDEAKKMFGDQDWSDAPEMWPDLSPKPLPSSSAWATAGAEWADPHPDGPHEMLIAKYRGNPIQYAPGTPRGQIEIINMKMISMHPNTFGFADALRSMDTESLAYAVERVNNGAFPPWWAESLVKINAEMQRRIRKMTPQQKAHLRNIFVDPWAYKRNPSRDDHERFERMWAKHKEAVIRGVRTAFPQRFDSAWVSGSELGRPGGSGAGREGDLREQAIAAAMSALWENLDRWEEADSPDGFAAVVGKNKAYDILRRTGTLRGAGVTGRGTLSPDAGWVPMPEIVAETASPVDPAMTVDVILGGVAATPKVGAEYAELLRRRYLKGWSLEKLAADAGTSVSAVKNKLLRARNVARKQLPRRNPAYSAWRPPELAWYPSDIVHAAANEAGMARSAKKVPYNAPMHLFDLLEWLEEVEHPYLPIVRQAVQSYGGWDPTVLMAHAYWIAGRPGPEVRPNPFTGRWTTGGPQHFRRCCVCGAGTSTREPARKFPMCGPCEHRWETEQEQAHRGPMSGAWWEADAEEGAHVRPKLWDMQDRHDELEPPRTNPLDLLVLTNPTKIASLLFEKKKWTRKRIKKWLKDHGYKTTIAKTKKTERYYRAPQRSTKPKVRTITFSEKEGIKALVLVEEETAARTNPEPSSEALEQYQAFHASEPQNIVQLPDGDVPVPPKELVMLGELEHVQYKAPDHSGKKGAPWRHRFGDTVDGMDPNAELPILATDKDGKGLYIVGGDYEVKPEGIVR